MYVSVCFMSCDGDCPALIGNLIYGFSWQRAASADSTAKVGHSRHALAPTYTNRFALPLSIYLYTFSSGMMSRTNASVATCRLYREAVTPTSRTAAATFTAPSLRHCASVREGEKKESRKGGRQGGGQAGRNRSA